jgi:extradiol dioxygenase family protein
MASTTDAGGSGTPPAPGATHQVLRPFHLAFPVHDLAAARRWYEGVLGCGVGRTAERWIDFDFFGHQITAHLSEDLPHQPTNTVDGEQVPVRHFGVILEPSDWATLARRLREAGTEFLIPPTTRFAGQPGEQSTMFLHDPSGNALEFKAFASDEQIFDAGTKNP